MRAVLQGHRARAVLEHLHAAAPLFFRSKKGKTVVPHCALRIIAVADDAPASLSNAYQNEILRIDDYIVGINDVYPKHIDALIVATEKSLKRRVINVIRPRNAREDCDDDDEMDTIEI